MTHGFPYNTWDEPDPHMDSNWADNSVSRRQSPYSRSQPWTALDNDSPVHYFPSIDSTKNIDSVAPWPSLNLQAPSPRTAPSPSLPGSGDDDFRSPWLSPVVSYPTYSPDLSSEPAMMGDDLVLDCPPVCVAPHEVQPQPFLTYPPLLDDNIYPGLAGVGLQWESPALREAPSEQSSHKLSPPAASTLRRTSTNSGRVTKSGAGRTNTFHRGTPERQRFQCPFANYGCTSRFGAKNEWKRHVSTQHLHLSFWQCDQCPRPDGRPLKEYNRKDLFIQHLRRMHSSHNNEDGEDAEDKVAMRCFHHRRPPPSQSRCLFCPKTFCGPKSWEQRMEHIGKHFEDLRGTTREPHDWIVDKATENYLIDHDLVAWKNGKLVLKECGIN
ncbi:hypothetical protein K470DRAFT_266364 [Piedraia hortae CBS 480.64]|uniref:C2H2-type domain-containing protein n=1 Tax=Piedraia hortae CBS 480.64 TaxID=1314780 RepID=A0A6A7BS56_9PEZI|nr:hypothetical protein K470DRAFT_266364 [Piedraia hortae CBS 480.64]